MLKKEINTNKTARYFVLGEVSEAIEEIWIVCHGYAQLANYFLKKFTCLEDKKRLLIAPEGLHRFYWEGFSGRVVASWMTKEDRLSDINDYVTFLDNLALETKNQLNKDIKLKVVGFSQGAATVCRWLALGNTKIDELIIWGSVFPEDIDYFKQKEKFKKAKIKVVIGTEDEYYTQEKIELELNNLHKKGIDFDFINYKGKHDLYDEILLKVSK